jgi:hypothetical protein
VAEASPGPSEGSAPARARTQRAGRQELERQVLYTDEWGGLLSQSSTKVPLAPPAPAARTRQLCGWRVCVPGGCGSRCVAGGLWMEGVAYARTVCGVCWDRVWRVQAGSVRTVVADRLRCRVRLCDILLDSVQVEYRRAGSRQCGDERRRHGSV